MSDFAGIVEERGRKAIRVILETKERVAGDLESEAADELRGVIVDQVSELYRLGASLLRNVEGQLGSNNSFSQQWLEAIGEALGVDPPAAPVLSSNGNGHGRRG